jgi:hypothetical protein
MRYIIILITQICFTLLLGQEYSGECGVFISKDNKSICYLENDSIGVRLFNNDAFATNSGFFGKYITNSGRILTLENLLEKKTSKIDKKKRNDKKTRFIITNKDGSTIKYPSLKIELLNKDLDSIMVFVPDSGFFIEPNFLDNYFGEIVCVTILTIGFQTKQIFVLEKGVDYVITSTVSKDIPLSCISTKLTFELTNNATQLKLIDYYGNEILFYKVDKEYESILSAILN